MEALASMMMVATLSSRISFSSGVGSMFSSSIRTDSVSLEIRKRWTSSSNRSRPEGRSQTPGRNWSEPLLIMDRLIKVWGALFKHDVMLL